MKPWHIILAASVLTAFLLYYRSYPLTSKVVVRGVTVTTDVAVTEAQKQKGLGGRMQLPADQGMLFVYDHKEAYNFWMRGMQFPLDFIWIDGSVVADITRDVPPPSAGETPAVVKPRVPVDRVLEVNAGFAQRHNIAIGDPVIFLDR